MTSQIISKGMYFSVLHLSNRISHEDGCKTSKYRFSSLRTFMYFETWGKSVKCIVTFTSCASWSIVFYFLFWFLQMSCYNRILWDLWILSSTFFCKRKPCISFVVWMKLKYMSSFYWKNDTHQRILWLCNFDLTSK